MIEALFQSKLFIYKNLKCRRGYLFAYKFSLSFMKSGLNVENFVFTTLTLINKIYVF